MLRPTVSALAFALVPCVAASDTQAQDTFTLVELRPITCTTFCGARSSLREGRFPRRGGLIGTRDHLLDLLDDSLRLENTTDDPVDDGGQSHDADDQTRDIVERE